MYTSTRAQLYSRNYQHQGEEVCIRLSFPHLVLTSRIILLSPHNTYVYIDILKIFVCCKVTLYIFYLIYVFNSISNNNNNLRK